MRKKEQNKLNVHHHNRIRNLKGDTAEDGQSLVFRTYIFSLAVNVPKSGYILHLRLSFSGLLLVLGGRLSGVVITEIAISDCSSEAFIPLIVTFIIDMMRKSMLLCKVALEDAVICVFGQWLTDGTRGPSLDLVIVSFSLSVTWSFCLQYLLRRELFGSVSGRRKGDKGTVNGEEGVTATTNNGLSREENTTNGTSIVETSIEEMRQGERGRSCKRRRERDRGVVESD
ncbi:unnamed protein product [Cercopithifilaria johnstoni]|uniref:Uncharacterized protein n=1 Tax=Cercopithifilaria johnstoni TaxID=2874296 RepID=A0A8J2M308_9BILA|nr:unnamed protein product [Cercopithifilaria johnstoni]